MLSGIILVSFLFSQTTAQYNHPLSFVKANRQNVTVRHSSNITFTNAFTMEAVVNRVRTNASIIDKANYDFSRGLNASGNLDAVVCGTRNTSV